MNVQLLVPPAIIATNRITGLKFVWQRVAMNHRRKAGAYTVEEDDDNDSDFYVKAITSNKETSNTVSADIELGMGNVVRFKIDTGAQVNEYSRQKHLKNCHTVQKSHPAKKNSSATQVNL